LITTSRLRGLLFAALLALNWTQAEGITMDDKLHQKIAEAVHTEYAWKVEEVGIDEVERLHRGSCSFYTARSTVRPLSYQPNYAVLRGSEVIGISDHEAATKILDACSDGAPAEWWAEVITRFHHEVGGGIVLSDESARPDIVRKLAQAGKPFTPPTFGDGKKSVSFLLLDPEAYIVYSVQATRTPSGPIEVVRTQLLGKTSGGTAKAQTTTADARAKIEQALR
jgi:hypothetical protein